MDFYLMPDAVETPAFPEELGLVFLGNLALEEFRQVERFFPKEVDYFEDFRLVLPEVEVLYTELRRSKIYENSSNNISYILKTEEFCKKAIAANLGIVGFSD